MNCFFCAVGFRLLSSVASRWLILAAVAACAASSAGATQLRLKNGDVLTGDFVGRKDGKIVFHSPLFGQLSVEEKEAVVVEAPETPVESLVGIPPEKSSPPAKSPSASKRTAAAKPKKNPWRGQLEFGFQQQDGRNDVEQLSLRGEAEKKAAKDVFRIEGKALYNRQNQKTTADRYDAAFRYRHDLSDRLFGQSRTSYSKDRVKLVYDNVEENVGLGYRFIDGSRHIANVGSGLTAQYRDAEGFANSTAYLFEFFQDYTYKLTGRITLVQDSNLAYAPQTQQRVTVAGGPADEAANYRLRYNTALRGKVSERVSLNLRFEYEFDNAIADPRAKVSQRVTSSVGYGF